MPNEVKPWDMSRVQAALAHAHDAASQGAKSAAERILQHAELREALDWLVTRHFRTAKQEREVVTLSNNVLQETRLMPAIVAHDEPRYTIKHVGRFDKAVRALKDYIDKYPIAKPKDSK